MAQQMIYFGRFTDTPSADHLRIRIGAVLVSSKNGRGVIEKADWTVNGANDAASKLGVEAPVVTAKDDGFFFPGFIGQFSPSFYKASTTDTSQTHIFMRLNIPTVVFSANPPSSTGSQYTPSP